MPVRRAHRSLSFDPDRVEKLYVTGLSLAQVAARFGVHQAVIRRILLARGVRLRSQRARYDEDADA